MPADKFDLHESITNRFIDEIQKAIDEGGNAPWNKPWINRGGLFANLVSKKPYRGINQMLLMMNNAAKGYASPYYLSYKQAAELSGPKLDANNEQEFHLVKSGPNKGKKVLHWNGGVRNDEKGTIVVFYRRITKEEKKSDGSKEKKSFGFWRYYTVFNVEQCDGIDHKIPVNDDEKDAPVFTPIEAAERIVNSMPNPPHLSVGGNRAAYAILLDTIMMPEREQFHGESEYYSTLFHELIHATGHEKRLNRDGIARNNGGFGSESYSKEELVAEIGAAFLNAECGILDNVFDNSVVYLTGWLSALKNDPKLIISAASKAHAAADNVMGVVYDNSDNNDD
jgi:antirestriction protein ArdC